MVDNVAITPGSGATIAADELTDATLGTVKVQYLKLMDGTIDSSNKAVVSSAGALKVDGSGVTQPVSGTFWQVTQPVSGTVTVTQGTAANLLAQVSGTVAATQSGNWTARVVGNAGATLDASAGQNQTMPTNMLMVGAQFNTTSTTVASGNCSPLQMDSAANLKVNTIDPAAYNAGSAWASGTSLNTAVALINSTAVSYDCFVGQITQTTTLTAGAVTFEESFDNGATFKVVSPTRLIDPSTGNQIPNPYTFVASTNQAFQIIPSGTCQIRARLSTVITGTGNVTISWTTCPITAMEYVVGAVAGDFANGVTDGGYPQKIGGVGKTANPTAVTDGQRVNAIFDKLGKQIVVGAIRNLKGVQQTAISTATETTIVTAGAAGVFNDVYSILITNTSATAASVTIKDSTAGTTRMVIAAPAGDTRGFSLPVDSAMVQATAANNWTATSSGAVSSLQITALYVQNL
jgi:hypothetical protein